MASKDKDVRLSQKAYWEERLNRRLAGLVEKGLESKKVAKDTAVKKIRAKMRETEARIKVIEGLEKKAEKMAKIKAEKKADPKQKKGKKKEATEEKLEKSKRQQKKKKKKEAKDK